MRPLLAQLIIGFFSFLFFAAPVYSTKEANKAGLKQSIFLDVYVFNKPTSSSDRDILLIFSNFILILIFF